MAYYSPEVMAGRIYLVKPRDFVRSYDMNLLRDAAHTVYNAMIEKGRTPYDEDLEFYLSQWPKLEYKSGISSDHLFIKRKVCEYLYKKYVYTYRHSGKSVRRVERAISYCKRKLDELIERDEEVYWTFPVKHIDHNLPAEFLMEMLETVKILPHIKYKYPLQTMTERVDSRCTGCYKIMPLPTLKREVVKAIPNFAYSPSHRALLANVVRPSWPSIVYFRPGIREILFLRFYDMKVDMKIYTMEEIHDVALYDVDGDGLCEVIVLTKKSLSIYDNDGKLIKQTTLPASVSGGKLNIVDGKIIAYARTNVYCFDFDLKQMWYRDLVSDIGYSTICCFAENLHVRPIPAYEASRIVAIDLEDGSIAWELHEKDGLPPGFASGVASTYERKSNKFIGFVSIHRHSIFPTVKQLNVARIDKYGNIELVRENICSIPWFPTFWFSFSGDMNGNGIEEAVFEDAETFTVVVDPLTLSAYGCFYAVDPDYTYFLTRIFLADYTGDGTIDIIASETAGNNIVIRNYKGEILESWFTGYLYPSVLGVGDVDMDHKAELIVGWTTFPEEESRLVIIE